MYANLKNNNSTNDKNHYIASQIARDCLEYICNVTTYPPPNLIKLFNENKFGVFGLFPNNILDKFAESEKRFKELENNKPVRRSPIASIVDSKNSVIQYEVGACGVLVETCLHKIYSDLLNVYNYSGSIEVMKVFGEKDNHTFIVLNRPAESNSTDWKTWGSSTIILDPWIKYYFDSVKFPYFFGDILEKIKCTGDIQNLLTHKLEQYDSLEHSKGLL